MNKNYVVLVNDHDNILGKELEKTAHQRNLLHRVVVIYITSPNGKILIQTRTDGRLDHSCAGHVNPGESYEQAARRELMEELHYSPSELTEVGMTVSFTHFYKIYKTVAPEADIDESMVNKYEVKKIAWIDPLTVLDKMNLDSENKIFTRGSKATLKVYLKV